jgi:hypothetical protein
MTAKEKAQELFDKYFFLTLNVESDDDINKYTAKYCALIAIDELIYYAESKYQLDWFREIKNEIEKL